MNIFYLIFFFILFVNNCSAQFAPEGWFLQSSNVETDLNSIAFINAYTGWCVGKKGLILYTTDSGNNWVNQAGLLNEDLEKIIFSSSETGYIVGKKGVILKTTDRGINWYQQVSGTIGNLTSVSFANDSTGYISGLNNILLKTTNGGYNWNTISFQDSVSYYSIYFINNTTGWLSSVREYSNGNDSAFIIKTINGGINWINQSSRKMDIIPNLSLQFTDSLNGWCTYQVPLLSASRILRTTNGGNLWSEYGGFPSEYYNLFFINKWKGWIAGPQNRIYRTTDGGQNGIFTNAFPNFIFYKSIFFTNSLLGWAVGNGGIILKTTTGGVLTNFTNISSETPENFSLSQNYPNPFNPKTVVNYELRVTSFAKLIVYDVLGNEVAELVNEKQNAGSYSAEFDGSGFASGIYFYSLITDGEVIDTKRMILLK